MAGPLQILPGRFRPICTDGVSVYRVEPGACRHDCLAGGVSLVQRAYPSGQGLRSADYAALHLPGVGRHDRGAGHRVREVAAFRDRYCGTLYDSRVHCTRARARLPAFPGHGREGAWPARRVPQPWATLASGGLIPSVPFKSPGLTIVGDASVVANLSSGQVGIQGNVGAVPSVGGGGVVAGNFSAGLNEGPLQSGISTTNTAFAQVTAVTATGTPVDVGGAVQWSNGGGNVSVGFKPGVGSYIGAGGGQVMTGTLVTPPLKKDDR